MARSRDNTWWFRSPALQYGALRALSHAEAGAASLGEVLSVVREVSTENAETWFGAWQRMGQFCQEAAEKAGDDVGRGQALLRASNYFRTAEFFLAPEDGRRIETYDLSRDLFCQALDVLEVAHEIWTIPWERAEGRVYYFPGQADRPLILVCGGFDSTNEESYFFLGQAAARRGYPCLMFEGPGQSGMLRHFGMTFTPDWAGVVGRVLDEALERAPDLVARPKFLVGVSLGGTLVLRAAALEKRLDGVVCWGGLFSLLNAALEKMPGPARRLFLSGKRGLFNWGARLKARFDLELRWGLDNGRWTLGATDHFDVLTRMGWMTVEDVADQITAPVLILRGAADHLVPAADADRLRKSLTRAADVEEVVFGPETGAAAHCQVGAGAQATAVIFAWIDRKVKRNSVQD